MGINMSLRNDITALKELLDEVKTIDQLKRYLYKTNLRLIAMIYSSGFSCLDCNITEQQVRGVLNLGLRIKISKLSTGERLIENQNLTSIHLSESDWVDQTDLFESIKSGIRSCITKT